MIKEKKYSLVNNLIERYNECEFLFLFEFTGVTVSQISKLRNAFSGKAQASVIKNTLNKIATKSKFNNIHSGLKGQVLTISTNDPISTSKALSVFVKEFGVGKILGYSDNAKFYGEAEVQKYASLPSESEMKAKLLGSIMGVPATLLRLVKHKYSNEAVS